MTAAGYRRRMGGRVLQGNLLLNPGVVVLGSNWNGCLPIGRIRISTSRVPGGPQGAYGVEGILYLNVQVP